MKSDILRAIMGVVFVILGWFLFYADIPVDHNHNIQMTVGGLLILLGGYFIDKDLTKSFLEHIKAFVFLFRGEKSDPEDEA